MHDTYIILMFYQILNNKVLRNKSLSYLCKNCHILVFDNHHTSSHSIIKQVYNSSYCNSQHKKWNDEVHWLYKSSTALFPSIYLMDAISDNKKYVADRLQEAFRVSRMISSRYGHELPVFPYLRPVYHYGARDFKMLNEVGT